MRAKQITDHTLRKLGHQIDGISCTGNRFRASVVVGNKRYTKMFPLLGTTLAEMQQWRAATRGEALYVVENPVEAYSGKVTDSDAADLGHIADIMLSLAEAGRSADALTLRAWSSRILMMLVKR